MPNNCISIVKKASVTLFCFLLVSCVGINNYSNSAAYKGKVVINSLNSEKSSFNILLTTNENFTIIQIQKPFYGNFLQIKYDNSTNLMKYISMDGSYEIDADIPRNIQNIVNNCLLRKNYLDELIQSNQSFNIKCYKDNQRTNFYIKYKNSFFEGFLIKDE